MVSTYAKLLAKYPLAFLVCISLICVSCILCVFLLTELPDFSDPIKGFETRGTEISQRTLALKNLRLDLDHIVGQNTVFYRYPDEYELARNSSKKNGRRTQVAQVARKIFRENSRNGGSKSRPILERVTRSEFGNASRVEMKKKKAKVQEVDPRKPPAYCNTTPSQGSTGDEYAMLALEMVDGSDLFSLSILNDLCEMEQRLWSESESWSYIPRNSCQVATKHRCCQAWHLASVASHLLDKFHCSQINETDVQLLKYKVEYCREYASTIGQCWTSGESECLKTIPVNCSSLAMHVLYKFILPKEYSTADADIAQPPVTLMILPVAKAEYSDLELQQIEALPSLLTTDSLRLVAMDLGIRDIVFQQYLLDDTIFGALALLLVFLAMWVYSGSFLFTVAALIGIGLSVCTAYFVYRLVFFIDFFPFMNILTYVLVVGVGADDTFIFRSAWRKAKFDKNCGTHAKILSDTLSHAAVSMLVTSLTTAAAFYTNMFSSIVVVKCFGIFAGTTILTNYLLVITWLPACVVLCEKRMVFSTSYCWFCPRWCIRQQRRHTHEHDRGAIERRRSSATLAVDFSTNVLHSTNSTGSNLGPAGSHNCLRSCHQPDNDDATQPSRRRSIAAITSVVQKPKKFWSLAMNPAQRRYQQVSVLARVFFQKLLPWLVIKLRFFWILAFAAIAILSAVAVFYSPGLKLPTREYFQFFKSSHPFERWENDVKQRFAFANGGNRKLPMVMYVVWGVKPTTNAAVFNPDDTGTLEAWPMDNSTEFFDNVNLLWYREFCSSMAVQNFTRFDPSELPMLASCFVEDFMTTMRQRPCTNPGTGQSQRPCCSDVSFPYPPGVFQTCLRRFVAMERSTITLFDMTSGLGPSGPLFSAKTGKPGGLVVMFTSSYNFSFNYFSMDEFYQSANRWITSRLQSGPDLVREGWLIADHLQLYDLQRALTSGTRLSVLIAVAIAFAVLFVTTWNPLISLLAILSISSIIVTTIAILILLDWELNVLESTIIILTIGLSFDFTLHYGVAYKLCPNGDDRESRVVYALGEVGSPVFMAFITTFLAGAAMLPATTLAYFQIGLFMMLETAVSWLYATFFFTSLLHCVGPSGKHCQFNPTRARCNDREKKTSVASPVPGTSRRISRDIGADAALAAAARRKKSSIVSFNAVAFNTISGGPISGGGSKLNVLSSLDYSRLDARRAGSSRECVASNEALNQSGWVKAITVETEPMLTPKKRTVIGDSLSELPEETQLAVEEDNDNERKKKSSIKERAVSVLAPVIRRLSAKSSSVDPPAVELDEQENSKLCGRDESENEKDRTSHQDVPYIDGDTSLQSINAQLNKSMEKSESE